MKAEQPEKTHLEESAWSETQVRSPCPHLALPRLHVAHKTNMSDDRCNSYKKIFPIIIDDQSVGSIRLFPMIDYEISANSQH